MKMKKINIMISIFLIAFSFGFNITGITPVLGVLSEKYASYGTSMVQLMQTLPYALLMVGSLILGWLTTKFTKKKLAVFGLFLVGFCGILPLFWDSFGILFISRLFIGFGFGILGPINTAIISDFFLPKERAGYLGLHVVGMGIGGMFGNLLGGILANRGYQSFFLVYAAAFACMAGVMFLLQDTPIAAEGKSADMKLNKEVYLISLTSFVHTLCISVYNTNVAIYVLKYITENTAVTGVITAVNAVFALIVGASFGKIAGFLKKYTLGCSILAAAAGYAAMIWIPGIAGIYIGSALCGVSLSCFNARGSFLISVSVEPNAVAKASGIFALIGGIGGLISPVFMGAVSSGIWGDNTTLGQFELAFAGMLILGIIVMLAEVLKKRKEQEVVNYGCNYD